MLTAKRISFSLTLLHAVNMMDITNYGYNKAKSPIDGTPLLSYFTVHVFEYHYLYSMVSKSTTFIHAF